MVEVVTCIVGVVTHMLCIVERMGNYHMRVMHLQSLTVIVGGFREVVVDLNVFTGVFVLAEGSMRLRRIPIHMHIVIIIAVLSL